MENQALCISFVSMAWIQRIYLIFKSNSSTWSKLDTGVSKILQFHDINQTHETIGVRNLFSIAHTSFNVLETISFSWYGSNKLSDAFLSSSLILLVGKHTWLEIENNRTFQELLSSGNGDQSKWFGRYLIILRLCAIWSNHLFVSCSTSAWRRDSSTIKWIWSQTFFRPVSIDIWCG